MKSNVPDRRVKGSSAADSPALTPPDADTAPRFDADTGDGPTLAETPSANGVGPADPTGPSAVSIIAPEPDPFDPARLRLSQDFASAVGARKLLTRVPVTRPEDEWWVRTCPNLDYWLPTAVIELRADRDI